VAGNTNKQQRKETNNETGNNNSNPSLRKGYVANIPTEALFHGYDEWHSVTISNDESWDINFHMCGEPNTLHVVAHPERTGADGFRETDMSSWVKVADFHRELPTETESGEAELA